MTHPASLTDPSQRWQAVDSVLASPLGGEVVLLEPEAGFYYSLNEVGAFIWDLLHEPSTVAELSAAVVAEFEVDLATCLRDVTAILNELLEHGLVEVETAPTP